MAFYVVCMTCWALYRYFKTVSDNDTLMHNQMKNLQKIENPETENYLKKIFLKYNNIKNIEIRKNDFPSLINAETNQDSQKNVLLTVSSKIIETIENKKISFSCQDPITQESYNAEYTEQDLEGLITHEAAHIVYQDNVTRTYDYAIAIFFDGIFAALGAHLGYLLHGTANQALFMSFTGFFIMDTFAGSCIRAFRRYQETRADEFVIKQKNKALIKGLQTFHLIDYGTHPGNKADILYANTKIKRLQITNLRSHPWPQDRIAMCKKALSELEMH